MNTKWQFYIFRCHRLGDIMGKPKGDNLVTDTAKSYLYEVYDQEMYGIKEVLTTKEIRKGLECEQDSIDLTNAVHGTFFCKNTERRKNKWIQGEADIVAPNIIVDIKTAWNMKTFKKSILTVNDYWQMMGYLWLWEKAKGFVARVLVDTPYEMIADAKRQLSWQLDMIDDTHPDYIVMEKQLERNMTFSHIAPHKRVKAFQVDYFEDKIEFMKERIEAARLFLQAIADSENNYPKIEMNGKRRGAPMGMTVDEHIKVAAQVAASVNDVTVEQMQQGSRRQDVMSATHQMRMVVLPLFSNVTTLARKLGVNHATIINSQKKHANFLKHDKDYKKRYAQVQEFYSEATNFKGA